MRTVLRLAASTFVSGWLLLFATSAAAQPAHAPTVATEPARASASASVGAPIVVVVLVLLLVCLVLVARASLRDHRRRPLTGADGMRGAVGLARSLIEPATPGRVLLRGETWRAISQGETIAPGEQVVVASVDGLLLTVRRLSSTHASTSLSSSLEV